ncbi:MAG TPA: BlaI/MecI/CopY family transcriptional regulator [Pseudonocardiaceae bacterium]|jgi:predicted transcriptional regulator|nr:BlaI/MecI/CopY family transcriptional regulator [Pseudonocardiaceae bacterium]
MPVESAGAKRTRRRAGGELENEILATLWAAGQPLTPREVQQALGKNLAYNTVQTILVRLHEKGLAQRHPDGRAHRYSPTKQPAELTAERMHVLLTAGPDRRSVLRRFVGGLNETDEQILRDALGRTED